MLSFFLNCTHKLVLDRRREGRSLGDSLAKSSKEFVILGEETTGEEELATNGEGDLGVAAILLPPEEPIVSTSLETVSVEDEALTMGLRVPLDQVDRVRPGTEKVAVGASGAVDDLLEEVPLQGKTGSHRSSRR